VKKKKILLKSPEAVPLIKRAQAGDNDAMATLIKDNGGVIGDIVRCFKGWAGPGLDLEDIEQWAVMGFMAGVNGCDTANGGRADYILTAARFSITNHLGQFGRLVKRPLEHSQKTRRPIEAVAGTLVFVPPKDRSDDREVIDRLMRRSRLTPRESEVLLSVYGLEGPEETCEEASRRLGISGNRTRNILDQAMSKVRRTATRLSMTA
jgi:RNA polymerase sigma factor (sigma-70 family)